MQISAVRPNPIHRGGVPGAPGAPAAPSEPAAQAPATPARELYDRIGRDVLRMPGIRSMLIYGASRPDELGVVAVDERAAAALAGVLEPTIDGVHLRILVGRGHQPYTGPAGRVMDRIAILDALTGVWDHKGSFLPRGNGTVTFRTIDQATIDRLDPILQNRWNAGQDAKGWTIWVNVRWKAGLSAGGAAPDGDGRSIIPMLSLQTGRT